MAKNIRLAKVLQAFFLISIIIYSGILLYLRNSTTATFEIEPFILNLITVMLTIIGIVTAVLGIKLPRRIVRRTQKYGIVDQSLLTAVVLQSSLLEAIAIYGLVLGIIGARLEIAILFIVVSAGLFILTFPSEEKFKKWLE